MRLVRPLSRKLIAAALGLACCASSAGAAAEVETSAAPTPRHLAAAVNYHFMLGGFHDAFGSTFAPRLSLSVWQLDPRLSLSLAASYIPLATDDYYRSLSGGLITIEPVLTATLAAFRAGELALWAGLTFGHWHLSPIPELVYPHPRSGFLKGMALGGSFLLPPAGAYRLGVTWGAQFAFTGSARWLALGLEVARFL